MVSLIIAKMLLLLGLVVETTGKIEVFDTFFSVLASEISIKVLRA